MLPLLQTAEVRWQTRVETVVTAAAVCTGKRHVVLAALRNGYLAAFRLQVRGVRVAPVYHRC